MMNAGCNKAIGEFTTSTVSFVLTIKHCCTNIAHSNEEQNTQSSCRFEHFLHLYTSNFSGVETILKIADGRECCLLGASLRLLLYLPCELKNK